MKSAREWKDYYARERAGLGEAGLLALVDKAADSVVASAATLPRRAGLGGALDARTSGVVFPHTRLTESGHLTAAVALSLVRAGYEEVVALGVLHSGRESDAALVRRAREGAPSARTALRRVHGEGTPGDAGHWTEEFSLDGFCALVDVAAKREGRKAPRVVARYPFLVGEQPGDLPGVDELRSLLDRGAALVATADPIHHGAGYGAREEDRMPREDPQTLEFARWTLDRGFGLLAARDFGGFLRHALEVKSDFRDTGPVLTWLVDPARSVDVEILQLELVDYSTVLDAPPPTWVAAAVTKFQAKA